MQSDDDDESGSDSDSFNGEEICQRLVDVSVLQEQLENLTTENVQETAKNISNSSYLLKPYDLMYNIFIIAFYKTNLSPQISQLIQTLNQTLTENGEKSFISEYTKIYSIFFKKKEYFPLSSHLCKLNLLDSEFNFDPPEIPDIIKAIRDDDVDYVKQYNNQHQSKELDINLLEPSLKLLKNSISQYEYAAFCGSIECCKYFILNSSQDLSSILSGISQYAIAGGHQKIIELCEESNYSFSDEVIIAAKFRQTNIYNFLRSKAINSLNTVPIFMRFLYNSLSSTIISHCPKVVEILFGNLETLFHKFISSAESLHLHFDQLIKTAINCGNREFLQILLENDSINTLHGTVQDFISISIKNNSLECFDTLLFKLLPNFNDIKFFSNIIQIIIDNNSLSAMKILLKYSNDRMISDSTFEKVPLVSAFILKEQEIVDLLIHEDIFLNITDLTGSGAIHYAAEHNLSFLKELSKQPSINMNLQTNEGLTPLLIAARSQSEAQFLFLLSDERVNHNPIDKNNCNLFHYATKIKNTNIIDAIFQIPELISDSSDFCNSLNKKKKTPLFTSINENNLYVLRKLIELPNLDPNIPDNDNFTPFQYAIEKMNEEIVDLLIHLPKIDINSTLNCQDLTLLQYFAQKRNLNSMELLLKIGADVNSINSKGETALHFAIGNKEWIEGINLLLNVEGIKVDIIDKSGRTPLRLAVLNQQINVIKALLRFPDLYIGNALTASIYSIQIIEILLQYPGASINDKDVFGDTILHCIVQKWNVPMLQYVLSIPGIDINVPNSDGLTPKQLLSKMKVSNPLIHNIFQEFENKDQNET